MKRVSGEEVEEWRSGRVDEGAGGRGKERWTKKGAGMEGEERGREEGRWCLVDLLTADS